MFTNTLIYIDFEYRPKKTKIGNDVVCVSTHLVRPDGVQSTQSWWLYNDETNKRAFRKFVSDNENAIWVCFNASAEVGSFIDLSLTDEYKWIDLQAEWKMLSYTSILGRGRQYIDGSYKYVLNKNDWYDARIKRLEDEDIASKYPNRAAKASTSLLSMTYKLLSPDAYNPSYLSISKKTLNLYGQSISEVSEKELVSQLASDYKVKQDMRYAILFDDPEKNKKDILSYCESDVADMQTLLYRVISIYRGWKVYSNFKECESALLLRGKNGAIATRIERNGYPVRTEEALKLKKASPEILKSTAEEIINLHSDKNLFNYNKKTGIYSKSIAKWLKVVHQFIEDHNIKDWPRTDKGRISLSKSDAFDKYFNLKYEYKDTNPMHQLIKYLDTDKALKGFKATKAGDFFDAVGDDDRVRCYLNPYGSKTGRFQPKQKHFMFLKPAWTRSLVHPKPGNYIVGVDYSSQEFLVSAVITRDKNMIEAYKSGDPYLYFAKLSGAVPEDGTKQTHKRERNLFKATTLGISYGMGAKSLARKLSMDMGEVIEEGQAQDLIEKFEKAYPDYIQATHRMQDKINRGGYLKLNDGWCMFNQEFNPRAIKNFPVQGTAALILRKAIQLLSKQSYKIVFPLHDAIYIELGNFPDVQTYQELVDHIQTLMVMAFKYGLKDLPGSELIRLDVDIWGEDVHNLSNELKGVNYYTRYQDARGVKQFEKLSKFFV